MLDSLLDVHDQITDRLPPDAYKRRPVRWILKLRTKDTSYNLIPTEGRANVPDRGRAGTAVRPRLIDTAEYTFGLRDKVSKKDRGQKTHQGYRDLVKQVANDLDLPEVQTLWKFVQTHTAVLYGDLRFMAEVRYGRVQLAPIDPSMGRQDIVLVNVDGTLLHEMPAVQAWWADFMASLESEKADRTGPCALTGKDGGIAATHYEVRRFGSALSSYNEKAFESYGLGRSENAWLTHSSQRRVGRALSWLVDSDDYTYTLNETYWVYWTDPMDTSFSLNPLQDGDTNYIEELLSSYYDGRLTENDTPLWTMCLQENQGRLIVRHFERATVGQVQTRLAQYFEAMEVNGRYHGSFALLMGLIQVSSGTKSLNDIPPWMEEGLMRTALTGRPVPYPFLLKALNRNQALGEVSAQRASLLKLYLITHSIPMPSALDPTYDSVAYQLGRLFSALEQAQSQALDNPNSTITDKFFKSASTTPQSVFGKLLGQAQAHLSKLRKNNKSAYTDIQKRIGAITSQIAPGKMPKTLSPEAQAEFALGYYHERQAMFERIEAAKKKKAEDEKADVA
ncbi:type I-C CRISPR-associated protein Cas8c/Csd1 [Longimonas halophila]|uniref:Type I-C CRISPR-associated protein Cas8c/Csd1 n=1 Tax=Longimonas halophila TaxID=1469170 RepID=A0A2H3P317_9BACT|nr:type I-C CRISPR-associated protein Cas8c/Csd1 [Longimonas halophila]PEN05663.1 type I-C CRISPR-associated protein Cas8c/Csd1 [Longimonas halophila]